MRSTGDDAARAAVHDGTGGVTQRARRVDHVIDDDAIFAGDVTDDVHHLAHVGAFATLVDDGQGRTQTLGVRARALHAARVRGDEHGILVEARLQVVLEEYRQGVQVIERDVEKTLNLAGVQVDGEHARDARRNQQIRDQLGGDRRARRDLAVLARVAVVRHHRGDGAG